MLFVFNLLTLGDSYASELIGGGGGGEEGEGDVYIKGTQSHDLPMK